MFSTEKASFQSRLLLSLSLLMVGNKRNSYYERNLNMVNLNDQGNEREMQSMGSFTGTIAGFSAHLQTMPDTQMVAKLMTNVSDLNNDNFFLMFINRDDDQGQAIVGVSYSAGSYVTAGWQQSADWRIGAKIHLTYKQDGFGRLYLHRGRLLSPASNPVSSDNETDSTSQASTTTTEEFVASPVQPQPTATNDSAADAEQNVFRPAPASQTPDQSISETQPTTQATPKQPVPDSAVPSKASLQVDKNTDSVESQASQEADEDFTPIRQEPLDPPSVEKVSDTQKKIAQQYRDLATRPINDAAANHSALERIGKLEDWTRFIRDDQRETKVMVNNNLAEALSADKFQPIQRYNKYEVLDFSVEPDSPDRNNESDQSNQQATPTDQPDRVDF